MATGVPDIIAGNDGWATSGQALVDALNTGFIRDESLSNATGALTTNATFVSATTFTVSGDRTASYVRGRRLRVVHTGGTTYCYVASSSYSAPNTTVTISGDATSGPQTMTTPITSVALALGFDGVSGNNSLDENFSRLMTTWGL